MKVINKYFVQQIRNIAVSQREIAYLTPFREVKRFISDCLESLQTPFETAQIIAGNMLAGDMRGRVNHGLANLEFYIQKIKDRKLFPEAKPLVMQQDNYTALIDGENGFGVLAARCASKIAAEKAEECGFSVVTVKGSNYCGLLSLHLLDIKDKGLLGIALSNDYPTILPTRGKTATIGANLLAVAAPGVDKEDFILDMNMRGCCMQDVINKAERNEKLPKGIALNRSMGDETDPKRALQANRFLPLGGKEAYGGHKGTGFAIMIDILTGALAGGNFATTFLTNSEKSDVCHTFIVINPNFFADNFDQRVADFLQDIRSLPPVDPKKNVLVPGDLENQHMAKVLCQDGIIYKNQMHEVTNRIADLLKVDHMKSEKICLTDLCVRN